jgi:FkbM family methyltransferase
VFLGISGLHHDSAVCLSDYDQLLFASQEERFSRIKFDSSWPSLSLNYVVENYDFSKIEAITFYEKPSIFNKFDIKNKLKNLGYKKEIFYLEHHHSHAYSSISLNEWRPAGSKPFVEEVEVTKIDLSEWIGQNLREDDQTILKMDIEGAEYDTLEKIISDGRIKFIKKLYIEWHSTMFSEPEKYKLREDKIIEEFKKFNIPVELW